MASINNNIRGKKLFKSGSSGAFASKGADGEYTISSEKATELSNLTDISVLYNDDNLYQTNKFLLKQIEDLRLDVEELHAFIKDFVGTSSTAGATGSFATTSGKTTKNITVTKGVITQIK